MQAKVVLILEALKQDSRVEFTRLLTGFTGRIHGVMTFLAGLELTRRGVLLLRQTRPFSELWIYSRNERLQEEPMPEIDASEKSVAGEDVPEQTVAEIDVPNPEPQSDGGEA
jgi:chromatin segregation and condensation protein Rec8/ScpA/Scc1 (kleisin family)